MAKRNLTVLGGFLTVATVAFLCGGERYDRLLEEESYVGPGRGLSVSRTAWEAVTHSRDDSATGLSLLAFASDAVDRPTDIPEAIVARRARVAVCFAPGTPPDIMAAVNEAEHRSPEGERYFLHGEWGSNPGSPVALTWSFVPDGTMINSVGSWDNGGQDGISRLFLMMDLKFGGDRQLWISRFEESFARWAELTGLSYTRITFDGEDWDDGGYWGRPGNEWRGDIRIAARNIDGPGSILAYDFFPSNGDMLLDEWEDWGDSWSDHRFLRNVVMHEHGHGLGLEHVCPQNGSKLMEPGLNMSFDGPRHDEVRGGQQNYGDPFENNNSAAEAVYLGTAVMGTPITGPVIPQPAIPFGSLISMDKDIWETEEDWYRFTITEPQTAVTMSIIPIGHSYDSSPQQSNGSCDWGNIIDSAAAGNLDLQIIDPDGATVLKLGSNAPAGSTETLTDVLNDPGDYYVRVYPNGPMSGSQLYEFELTVKDPGACCLADGSCVRTQGPDCSAIPGFYTADGTPCPPDPPCEPVPTLMSFELGATAIFPNSSVFLEIFTEEVDDLQTYQATITITRTSGEGTLEVTCPGGVEVDTTRPDFVFADLPPGSVPLPAVQCQGRQLGATILGGASVNVGSERKYLGHLTLNLSGDATAGSTFEIAIASATALSFVTDSGLHLIPTRFDPPWTLTVLDPESVRPPVPEPGGPACGVSSGCTGAYEGADCIAGTCYVPKNRYLSVDPTVNVLPVAYQIELTEAADYPTAVGRTWWVDEPQCHDYPDGNIVVPHPSTCEGPDRFGWVSKLTSAPVERLWTESPTHISDCAVVPAASFAIRASDDGGATLSFELEINTAHHPDGETQAWGDVTGGPVPGMPGMWLPPERATNFGDVGNAIRTFENRAEDTGAPPRVWVDVEIDQVVNLGDISFIVMAFEGRPYADIDLPLIGIHPADCP